MPDRISPSEFALKIKSKYPSYKDIDDSTLVSKILQKYPSYKESIDFNKAQNQPITKDLPTEKPFSLAEGYKPQFEMFPEAQKKMPKTPMAQAIEKDKEDNSTFLGAIADNVLNAFDPVKYAFNDAMIGMFEEVEGKRFTKEQKLALHTLGEVVDPYKSRLASKEYKQKVSQFDITDGHIGMNDVKGMTMMGTKMLTDIGVAAGLQAVGVPMAATFGLQGYGEGLKSYDEAVSSKNIEPNEGARQVSALASGAVGAIAAELGFDKLIGGGKVGKQVLSKITADALSTIAKTEGKVTTELIEETSRKLVNDYMKTWSAKGAKALHSVAVGGVTGGTLGLTQPVIQAITNKMQGADVYDPKELSLNGVVKSFVNGTVSGAVTALPFAGFHAFSKNTDNEMLNSIAYAKDEAQLSKVMDELNTELDNHNYSPEERDAVLTNAKVYADVKRTLPKNITAEKQTVIIPKIRERAELDNEIKSRTENIGNIEEALRPDEQKKIDALLDIRDGINDEIKGIAADEKHTFFEQDGKYYKKFADEQPIEISKHRFEHESAKDEADRVDKRVDELQSKLQEQAIKPVSEEPIVLTEEQKATNIESATDEIRADEFNKIKQENDSRTTEAGVTEPTTRPSGEVPPELAPENEFLANATEFERADYEKWRNDRFKSEDDVNRAYESESRKEFGETREEFLRRKYCAGS